MLVTGAGASVRFGRDGRRVPLMGDWASILVDALDAVEEGLASTIGLRVGIGGEAFEERVGAFLRWTGTLDATERFLQVGRVSSHGVASDVMTWMANARRRTATIIQAVNASLWREFGLTRMDPTEAARAYGALLESLGATSGATTRLFTATTNYDRLGEAALHILGFKPDTGARADPGRTERLQPDDIEVWADAGTVPHVHLHGAVGWYRDGEGIQVHPPDQEYDDRLSPAVLYPDPDKDPLGDAEAGVHALWERFVDALETATHVVVLGHSLHDRPLLDVLGAAARPGLRFAFCHYDAAEATAAVLNSNKAFTNAVDVSLVPVDFSPEHDFGALRAWADGATVQMDGSVVG